MKKKHLSLYSIVFFSMVSAFFMASAASENISLRRSLFDAIKAGEKKEIIQSIIDSPEFVGKIDAVDSKGKTALHYAAELKRPSLVKLLFDKGANVNAQDKKGNAPLHLAVENKNNEIVQLLLDFGADSGKYNDNKESPRALAKKLNNHTALALMENVKKQRMMFFDQKDAYYEVGNYRRLTQKPRHVPLVMIIDQRYAEEAKDSSPGAMTTALIDAIQARTFPILVSGSLLHNFVARRNKKLKEHGAKSKNIVATVPFDTQKWELYEVPNTQFTLLIPRVYSDIYHTQFKIKEFIKQSSLIGNLDNLENFLKNQYGQNIVRLDEKQDGQKQLAGIFAPTDKTAHTVLDIHLLGHGNNTNLVAGLDKKFMPRYFNFLNNKLSTHMLFITTCRAGGTVLNMIEVGAWLNTTEEGVKTSQFLSTGNIKYTIIVNAATDDSVHLGKLMSTVFNHYFNGAALLKGKGKELDQFVRSINLFSVRPKSIHGATNIPQVWLPGTPGFKTYNVDENVMIIDMVTARKAEIDKEPIEVKNKQVVFLYTDSTPDMKVYPFKETEKHTKIRGLGSDKKPQEALKGIFNTWRNKLSAHELLFQQKSDSAPNQPNYLYPQFMSMLRGDSIQHIKKISVVNKLNGTKLPLSGVMNFIRDSFFDSGTRESKKAFLIDTLSGNNDMLPLLKAARIKAGNKSKREFESFLQSKKDQNIKLNNVIVADYSKREPGGLVTKNMVGFIYGGRAWVFHLLEHEEPEPHQWYFKEVNIDDYNKLYKKQLKKLGALKDIEKARVGIKQERREHTYDNLYALYEKEFVPQKSVTPEEVLQQSGVKLNKLQDILSKDVVAPAQR